MTTLNQRKLPFFGKGLMTKNVNKRSKKERKLGKLKSDPKAAHQSITVSHLRGERSEVVFVQKVPEGSHLKLQQISGFRLIAVGFS